MQQISFAIGHFLEWSFTFLSAMDWLPVKDITVVMFVGMGYWLLLQSRYNKKAKANGTNA